MCTPTMHSRRALHRTARRDIPLKCFCSPCLLFSYFNRFKTFLDLCCYLVGPVGPQTLECVSSFLLCKGRDGTDALSSFPHPRRKRFVIQSTQLFLFSAICFFSPSTHISLICPFIHPSWKLLLASFRSFQVSLLVSPTKQLT